MIPDAPSTDWTAVAALAQVGAFLGVLAALRASTKSAERQDRAYLSVGINPSPTPINVDGQLPGVWPITINNSGKTPAQNVLVFWRLDFVVDESALPLLTHPCWKARTDLPPSVVHPDQPIGRDLPINRAGWLAAFDDWWHGRRRVYLQVAVGYQDCFKKRHYTICRRLLVRRAVSGRVEPDAIGAADEMT